MYDYYTDHTIQRQWSGNGYIIQLQHAAEDHYLAVVQYEGSVHLSELESAQEIDTILQQHHIDHEDEDVMILQREKSGS